MPRTAARWTQAEMNRAYRIVKADAGAAQFVFDPDGGVRVTPFDPGNEPQQVDPKPEIRL